jgi:hypothetical protein
MSALHFELRPDFGRHDVMLGVICIGQIWAFDLDLMWIHTGWQPALDIEAAKDALKQKVAAWLKAAGLRAA